MSGSFKTSNPVADWGSVRSIDGSDRFPKKSISDPTSLDSQNWRSVRDTDCTDDGWSVVSSKSHKSTIQSKGVHDESPKKFILRRPDINKEHSKKILEEIIGKCDGKIIENVNEISREIAKEINSAKNPGAASKIIEDLVAYHMWEILANPEINSILCSRKFIEGDGYTVLHWINWPKSGISGVVRSKDDALNTINVLLNAGFDSLQTDSRGESVIKSLKKAVSFKKIPIFWLDDMLQKYLYPPQISAISSIKTMLVKITPEKIDLFRTTFCWCFATNPEALSDQIVNTCLRGGARDADSTWSYVKYMINMCKDCIIAGPNVESAEYDDLESIVGGWNSSSQMHKFGYMIATSATLIDPLTLPATCLGEPLGAIVGESACAAIQKKYMIENLATPGMQLYAVSCLAHSKFFDPDVSYALIDAIDGMDFQKKTLVYGLMDKICGISIPMGNGDEELKKSILLTMKGKKYTIIPKYTHASAKHVSTSVMPAESAEYVSSYDTSLSSHMNTLNGLTKASAENNSDLIDDISYGIEMASKNFKNHNLLCENIIVKACNIISNDKQLDTFIIILKKIIGEKIISGESFCFAISKLVGVADELSEDLDSPVWAKKILGSVEKSIGKKNMRSRNKKKSR